MLPNRVSPHHHPKLVYQNILDALLHVTNIRKPAEVPVEFNPRVSTFYGKGTVPGTGDTKTGPLSGGDRRV